jgi:hypothetical protein
MTDSVLALMDELSVFGVEPNVFELVEGSRIGLRPSKAGDLM